MSGYLYLAGGLTLGGIAVDLLYLRERLGAAIAAVCAITVLMLGWR